MNSTTHLARTAGLLYLLVGLFGGFAEGFVEPKMYVAGDAGTTAQNLADNAGLVRVGVVADLVNQAVFVFVALTLYALFKQVHHGAATAMVVLVAVAAAIASLNVVFEFVGLRIATGAVDLSGLGAEGSNQMALLLLDTQHHGLLIAQIFFGLWLAPLGYLAHKSGWFPKPLAILLMVAAGCYLVDVVLAFLVPDLSQPMHTFIVIPCAVAEIWMVGYLLVIGVKRSQDITISVPASSNRISSQNDQR